MEKYFFVTFFIANCFLRITLSDDRIQRNIENDKNIDYREPSRNVRNYQDIVLKSNPNNYMGDIVMSKFERGGRIGDILQGYRYSDKTGFGFDGRGLYEKDNAFQFDAGNPDIHGEIRRPCKLFDKFCIRKFFAEHSKCKISGRPVPDPFYSSEGNYYFSSANISETVTETYYTGFSDARVSEFYINKATDNLVIAFTFEAVTKNTRNNYFQYYLRGREPVVTRGLAEIKYGALTVTVIIPHLANLDLARSEIYTYGDNSLYSFVLGPSLGESTDPEVVAMYAQFFTNVPTEYQEDIWNLGNLIAGNYIQYNICDFGLKVL